jgi:hypothetical protein
MGDPVELLYQRDAGEVQPGDAVLINGASGGVLIGFHLILGRKTLKLARAPQFRMVAGA